MSDPIEDHVRQIEALVGEAASVANRYSMKSTGSAHLLFVICGTEEGRRTVEEMGGNARRIRSFLEHAFEQNSQPGLATGGTEIDITINSVVKKVIARARENARIPQLSDVLQEMTFLGESCLITRQALVVGGVIETMPNRLDDISDFEDISEDESLNFDVDALKTPFDEDDANIADDVASALSGDVEPQPAEVAPAEESDADEHMKAVLSASRDLTSLAREGDLDDVIGMEDQIDQVVDTISKKKKPNLIVIGEPGIGKTALAEALASHLVSGNAPETLAGRPLLEVSLPDLVAGARFRGDFEARMRALVALARRRNAILFLDEIHMMVGAGSATGRGGMDAANILKPALARGDITVIGATTPDEMRELRRDRALMRRFDQLMLKEPDKPRVRRILDEAVGSYVVHHKVVVDDSMLDLIVELADRYLPAQKFPDKAFNVIDQACVIARKREAESVSEEDVRRAVERNGSVQLSPPDEETRLRLEELEAKMGEMVFGQPDAVKSMVRAARLSAMGMNRGGTAGAYLFNGPTGVGKTEMAYAFAKSMGYPLVRIDMSECMEKHAVSRLIGAPPGYVGFDQEGLLTSAADKHDDMVILLDEIEKAHPDVYDILLQILDYGCLRTGDGRVVTFGRAHIILSANIGASDGEKPALGFGRQTDPEEVAKDQVKGTFRKEMLARIPNQIQFGKHDEDARTAIVRKALGQASQRYADSGYNVIFDDAVVTWVAEAPSDDANDGRGIQDRIQVLVHDRVVDVFLAEPERRSAKVTVADDELHIA